MTHPSGEQHAIEGSGYRAVVTEVGATLRELRYAGSAADPAPEPAPEPGAGQSPDRELVKGFTADELRPVYRGAVLAPWPNRIADGMYTFGGSRHQLPLNEPDRMNALHGLVAWEPWRLVDSSASSVTLAYRLFPRLGYPWALELAMTYALGDDGLSCRLEATNPGDAPLPYGCAPHPYLVAGPGKVDDWTVEVPAEAYLEVTPDRLLPKETAPVEGTMYDFRTARAIGDTKLDTAYTELTGSRVVVRSGPGDDASGVAISWGEMCGWLQVHTADRADPELDRVALAVEPMTCPPNAFASGVDLITLEPGARQVTSWRIEAV